MERQKADALFAIEQDRELLWDLSDQIWEHPEVGFREQFAAKLFCDTLTARGFQVRRNLAGIPTAFSGSFDNRVAVAAFIGIRQSVSILPTSLQACVRPAIDTRCYKYSDRHTVHIHGKMYF